MVVVRALVVGLAGLALAACTSGTGSNVAGAAASSGAGAASSSTPTAVVQQPLDAAADRAPAGESPSGRGDGELAGTGGRPDGGRADGSEAAGATPVPEAEAVELDRPIELPSPLAAQIEGLIATVESLRGHAFVTEPVIRALSPEDVVARREESLREALAGQDFSAEEAFFEMFDVFGGPVDIERFYTEFYSASTLAYYDLDDHELVVPITGELLTPYEQWILVHELTHALADQVHPEVIERYVALAEADAGDEAAALLGLLEGEAVLVQSLFFDTLAGEERAALNEQAATRRNRAFAEAPAYFRTVTRFPYTDGSLFALYLYQRGGMPALDQAFATPPDTTEQIYAPDVYVQGVDSASTNLRFEVPFGYEVVERGTWGAGAWRALLGQFVNGGTAGVAVDGWGADEYALLWNPETHQVVFVSLFLGDSVRDAAEFGGAIEDFVAEAMDVDLRTEGIRTTRFTGRDYAEVQRVEDRTLLIAASNQLAGVAVRETVVGFRR
jgi:hypothetical protein